MRQKRAKTMNKDFRNIKNGLEIPTENYSDQPYFIQTDDGAWLCTVTTGKGTEGKPGQHVLATRSVDMGKTWSAPVDVDSAEGSMASYSVLLKLDRRIYCFYGYKFDNPSLKNKHGGDLFGYKYSEDNGTTWSVDRFEIPIRLMDIDRKNPYSGKAQLGWNVGRPFLYNGAAYVPYIKKGTPADFYGMTEGVLLKCANIDDKDCTAHVWETLPEGEYGLRTPPGGGPVSEEQSFSVLSDGSFYCVYRTIDSHPVDTYSRDGGHTWDTPQYKRYANGRLFKHPRAANFCWKCRNGKYLYWHHNNGASDFSCRNPVWISGGREADSSKGKIILWGQGEILFYDEDPRIGMSYPDLVEEDGRYFISETQKNYARVHEIPASFFDILWGQLDRKEVCKEGLLAGQRDQDYAAPGKFKMPRLNPFLVRDNTASDGHTVDCHTGFSLDLWLEFRNFAEGQTIFDSRNDEGAGIFIQTARQGSVEITLSDIAGRSSWSSDEGIFSNGIHHLGVIVDGGPKLIMLVTDGILNDGAGQRIFGFGRYSPLLYDVNGGEEAKIGSESINVKSVRIYSRSLMITEMIGNYHFGV
jgi:hypothetical protein